MKYSFTPVSTNRKVGPIPVTYSGAQTCPISCPLRGNGCYAELGPGASHWKRVTAGTRGIEWSELLSNIRSLPKKQLWRFNVAGDLPGLGEAVDVQMLCDLVAANNGRRGFTYTHKHLSTMSELLMVKLANENGFTINLSADNLREVDELKALNVGPVVVVLPSDSPDRVTTPGGHTVTACPAETRDDVTCATCQACAHAGRAGVIGFRAHGSKKKSVNVIVRG